MIGYASRTGTKRNLEALKSAGWGLMVSARGRLRTEGFARYALDNGAWTSYRRGEPFDAIAFTKAVEWLGPLAQFVVAPDVIAGGQVSLSLSRSWLLPLLDCCPRVLIPVQDGLEPADLAPLASERVGIFVGGTTRWKIENLILWGRFASEFGCYLHVGRVNTARRIRLCGLAGANSFDGSSASRFALTLPLLDAARRQTSFVL